MNSDTREPGDVTSTLEPFDHTQTPGALELDHELADALARMDSALDDLIAAGDSGDLMSLGPDRLVGFMRAFERHRSRLPVVDHAVVEAVEVERLWEPTVSKSAAGVIAETLKISRAEAKARVAAAAQYGTSLAMSGEVLEPRLAIAAAAQRDGELTCAQAAEIGKAMTRLGTIPTVDHEKRRDAERDLVNYAGSFGPNELHTLGLKLDEVLLPDGRLPREAITRARRGLTIGRQRADGTSPLSGDLTPEARVLLFTVLSPLAAPLPSDEFGLDTRTAAQRTHDALVAMCERLLDSGTLPASGGTPATLHVTIPVRGIIEAIDRAQQPVPGPARTTGIGSDGTRLHLDEVLRLAREAEVIPVYLTDTGGVLAYGRTKRLFTKQQTDAMIARDKGCTFPTCNAPPEWCERMHIIPWYLGGKTDLSNGALGCGYHHAEAEKQGWQLRMINGLPYWIPPARIDPDQRPLLNPRIVANVR